MASILLVEDQQLIAMAAAMILSDAGHEILGPAATVREALDLARAARPDLALVDIALAGRRSGVQATRELRVLGVASVFVTSQATVAEQNRSAALGVLRKPYTASGLVAAVEAALRLARGETPAEVPRDLRVFDPPS